MEIFRISKSFPVEEKYSLTDQIRRSSRSVCTNIAEGYRKRIYPRHFTSKMSDADGECSETLIWVNFSKDCEYVSVLDFEKLESGYEEVGRMVGFMIENPQKFLPKTKTIIAR